MMNGYEELNQKFEAKKALEIEICAMLRKNGMEEEAVAIETGQSRLEMSEPRYLPKKFKTAK